MWLIRREDGWRQPKTPIKDRNAVDYDLIIIIKEQLYVQVSGKPEKSRSAHDLEKEINSRKSRDMRKFGVHHKFHNKLASLLHTTLEKQN